MERSWWCEYAWLPEGPVAGVRVQVGHDGTITRVEGGAVRHDDDAILSGLVVPGFANVHSHAFHRALRGRTHAEGGTFWTWRERMYSLASRLDPDTYYDLAVAVYSEMVLAGITCVGEFHYLHHGPGGARYGDPNAMGEALREAARTAGIRMTLLDCVYLSAGIGVPLEGVQRRFDDGDAEGWANRVCDMQDSPTSKVGAAVHSVRAVPADQLEDVVDAVTMDGGERRPLHVHLSEQPAENAACVSGYGVTPTRLLADHGVLGPSTTAVHATHLSSDDIALLGSTGTAACICPTTERDLADGIGPARALADAGTSISLGTDQHALLDMFEEARALEMHERLASGIRGRFQLGDLLTAMTSAGHDALGWHGGGRIATGAPADLVCVRLDSVRTAGSLPEQALLAASAADVTTVVVDGRVVVKDGYHQTSGDVSKLLSGAIARCWRS